MEQPYMFPTLYNQYQTCLCPGDLRNQSISRHGVDQISRNTPSLALEELINYYNMTVWHFGPCVTFWPCLCDISARLVWHFGPLVRNEGERVSPYPHINQWRRL